MKLGITVDTSQCLVSKKQKNMKKIIGQIGIIVMISLVSFLALFLLETESYGTAALLFLWGAIFVPILLWSRTAPRKAFVVALLYYIISFSIKNATLGGGTTTNLVGNGK